jgi:hypothetical protein
MKELSLLEKMCRRIEQINFNYCRDQPLGHFFALAARTRHTTKQVSLAVRFCAFVTTREWRAVFTRS